MIILSTYLQYIKIKYAGIYGVILKGVSPSYFSFLEIGRKKRRIHRNLSTVIRYCRAWYDEGQQHQTEGSGMQRSTTNVLDDRRLGKPQ